MRLQTGFFADTVRVCTALKLTLGDKSFAAPRTRTFELRLAFELDTPPTELSPLSAVNVSLTRQCPLHAPQPVEERGEPKRNRTEVLLFSKPAYMHASLEFKEGD